MGYNEYHSIVIRGSFCLLLGYNFDHLITFTFSVKCSRDKRKQRSLTFFVRYGYELITTMIITNISWLYSIIHINSIIHYIISAISVFLVYMYFEKNIHSGLVIGPNCCLVNNSLKGHFWGPYIEILSGTITRPECAAK